MSIIIIRLFGQEVTATDYIIRLPDITFTNHLSLLGVTCLPFAEKNEHKPRLSPPPRMSRGGAASQLLHLISSTTRRDRRRNHLISRPRPASADDDSIQNFEQLYFALVTVYMHARYVNEGF